MKIIYKTLIVSMDAMTKVTQCVASHEIPVLQGIYGEEAVSVTDEKPEVVDVDTDPAIEYGRLIGKYGKPAIDAVYRNRDEVAKAMKGDLKTVTGSKDEQPTAV